MYMYMRDVRTRYGRYFLYAYFFWQCHLLGTLRETAAAFSYKSLSSLHLVQTRLWLYYEIVGLALNDFSLTLRIIAFCRQLFCLIFCCLQSIYYDSKTLADVLYYVSYVNVNYSVKNSPLIVNIYFTFCEFPVFLNNHLYWHFFCSVLVLT